MNRRAFLTALGAVATQQKLGNIPFDSPLVNEPASDALITTTRFPYVQNVRADKASILWATLDAGFGGVQYSPDGVNFNTVAARSRMFNRVDTGTANFVQYQADLTGLSADTEYVYRVTVNGADVAAAGDMRFRTPGSGPFNFFVLGDSGWGIANQTDEQYAISLRMLAEKPSLVLHLGDLVYNPSGTFDSYQRNYFNYYAASMSSVPFFPCPGNHDYEVQNAAAYLAIHALPGETVPAADRGRYYSFDWGNVHFVSLDAMLSLQRAVTAGGAMLRWLDNDLRSTRQFWKVVFFHQPPFATGNNEGDRESLAARAYLVPILERNGVQVVLCGHEHSYQRAVPQRNGNIVGPNAGTNYITSGGGGALLYPVFNKPIVAFGRSAFHYLRGEVRGMRITIRSIRYDGVEVLDNYSIAPTPAFSDEPRVPPITLNPGPSAGATIRIVGRALAAEESFVCTPALPSDLAGTVVTVNGRPIQLLYVSPTQIYGQLPFAVDGNITVRVSTANGFIETSI